MATEKWTSVRREGLSLKFIRQSNQEVSVNLTPLIDVVFLLLIFFMVSTTFTEESHLSIDLPKAENADSQEQPKLIDITITAEGEFSINGQSLLNTQLDTLRRALHKVAEGDLSRPLAITADARTPHQAVVTAMDAAGQVGFVHLSITTQESGN